MQNYTTIIGVIELRIQGHSYSTVQQRYSVGSSTAQLIMCKEWTKQCTYIG